MSDPAFAVIDFHSHYIHPSWQLPEPPGAGAQRAHWATIHRRIVDEAALVETIDSGDLAGRVINTPTALFSPDAGIETYRRINDQLAELAARQSGRVWPLASVDAFAGEAAAEELTRAVTVLGLRGVFVDSAKGDRLLDAPEARPVLAAAAALGAPVFVHPVNPQPLTAQLAPYGRLGTLLARGTVNSASLVALIAGGVLSDLPELKIVVTALAFGGVLLAGSFGETAPDGGDIRSLLRRQVHIDIMGLDPVTIRAAAELLGEDNVLAGSDWPIINDGPIRGQVEQALTAAGLDASARRKVGSLNALRLLGQSPSVS